MRLSGERFSVLYRIIGQDAGDCYAKAQDICYEQTVEFPPELVPAGFIMDEIVGRIESCQQINQTCCLAEISYAAETAAGELTQLLNVAFGNISIKPGIMVERLNLSPLLLSNFQGPRFGRSGLRQLLQAPNRPLLHTALKPMGLSAGELAKMAYQCAIGGIDIIKDDHGLTDQCFAPFDERVKRCAEAVATANIETKGNSIYVANVTAEPQETVRRARLAKEAGAQGLMIAPALTGLEVMRNLADDPTIALPVICHPAFGGSYVLGSGGISHYVLYGQIARLAGADASIYPNFGGRFSFSREECVNIALGTGEEMGHIKKIFPSPGGGMSLNSIPDSIEVYGNDVIFLIGGGLFRHGPDLVENCRYFRGLIDNYS